MKKSLKRAIRLIKESFKEQDQAIKSNPRLYRQITMQEEFIKIGGF